MQIEELDKIIEQKATEIVDKKEFDASAGTPVDIEQYAASSFAEKAKDFVGVVATQKAVQDEQLVEDITEKKKEELKENATASLKKEQAESKSAETLLQRSLYGVYEGVATYAGIKKPLPQKMQKALFTILATLQTVALIFFGVPTSLITITADCVDVIVKKLSSISKSARWLVLGTLIAFLAYCVALFAVFILRKYGVIQQAA